MKRKADPRHLARRKLVQEIFTYSFNPQTTSFSPEEAKEIKDFLPKIDALIEKAAPQFPLPKIAKIDVAILRLAVFELLFKKKEPPKVVIDEAIELAKEFGGEASPSFINGVLGKIYKENYSSSLK